MSKSNSFPFGLLNASESLVVPSCEAVEDCCYEIRVALHSSVCKTISMRFFKACCKRYNVSNAFVSKLLLSNRSIGKSKLSIVSFIDATYQ